MAEDVHAAESLSFTPAGGGTAPLGTRIGRAFVVLGLPVVADLLEGVLDRRVGGSVSALALSVRLHGAVVNFLEGALRLGWRSLQRAREIGPAALALWHCYTPTRVMDDFCRSVCDNAIAILIMLRKLQSHSLARRAAPARPAPW